MPGPDLAPFPQRSTSSATQETTTRRDYIRDGSVCDQSPSGTECVLDAGSRARAVGELRSNIDALQTAYFAALQSEQVELLLNKQSLNVGAEVLLGALSMALGFGIEVAALEVATQVLKRVAWEGHVAASSIEGLARSAAKTIKAASSPILASAKSSIGARFGGLSGDKHDKVLFLEDLKGSATGYWKAIRDQCLLGTDVGLLVGVTATDPSKVGYESLRTSIDHMYERYKDQHLEQVQRVPGGARKVVRLKSNNVTRLALVEMREATRLHASGHGESDYFEPASHAFIRWIDGAFEDSATRVQEERVGALETIDVGGDPADYPFMDRTLEVEEWAHRAKTGTLK